LEFSDKQLAASLQPVFRPRLQFGKKQSFEIIQESWMVSFQPHLLESCTSKSYFARNLPLQPSLVASLSVFLRMSLACGAG
jgi:hypothetical protein